ncbi:MAG: UvrD-helicase domain-containing protein [Verrucomicrobiota bacterium]|nr:UvrD-helicase domain-containing protein [Verrucomicrobiota bacterium]
MEPRDQSARTRFQSELDRNFSVVASAGSGKTRSVTDRIVQLARSPHAETALPRLVVLTFANRAADEMQQRARAEILEANLPSEVLAAFNRAWFGTIHAFCLKLLTDYGHYLGLPAPLELLTDDEDLWNEFVQEQTSVGRSLAPEDRETLLRLASIRQIMELGRCAGSAGLRLAEPSRCPAIHLSAVYASAKTARKSETIANSIAQLTDWEKNFRHGTGFVRWPICFTKAQGMDEIWAEAFAPLRRWVTNTAISVAREVQRDYRNFRLERGVVTYGDQIALADELLQHPEAAHRLRQLDHIVILDEAQDTDPAQFSVLLEITRPPEATGRWLETRVDPPRPGSFCMVGDFQQSIYHDRADLAYYQKVHDALVDAEAGDALTFSVTFRLDQRQLDFVNATFRDILHGGQGQVQFVELQPRPEVLPGQVIRFPLPGKLLEGKGKLKEHQIARLEADELARWLKKLGPEKLRARNWREVAILCPRRDWLRTMAGALRRLDLPVEVQSESDQQADSPAYAWLTALCTTMAEPRNHYEIVGVLREVFGVSDHDLAVFADAQGSRFQIQEPVTAAGIVSSQLADLTAIRSAILELPLFAAVDLLVERTALRARIASLPEEDFSEPVADLETLLTLAAETEANGGTLANFAEQLRSEMERQRPVRLSSENAIQLITAQKAKGSEWDAVIVPFLGRRIIPFSPRYPSVIRIPGSDEVIAALHKEDREAEVKEAYALLRRQEMERLLYVAVTRARHTLVLALDQELFANAKGKAQDPSQLKFFRGDLGESSAEHLAALSGEPDVCDATAAAWTERETNARVAEPAPPTLDALSVERARRQADDFIRKQNPSGFEERRDPTEEEKPAGRGRTAAPSLVDTPATLYGSWWHAFFEHFPWRGDPKDWNAAFAAMAPDSPEEARSQREWLLLLDHALRASVLTQFLQRPGLVVHTEYPFFWRVDESRCMEGVIDLLLVDASARKGLILDWKTNRLGSKSDGGRLRARYQPQIAAYSRAVRAITSLDVVAGLYATATGQLLMFEEDELSAEWARLAQLPAGEMYAVDGLDDI